MTTIIHWHDGDDSNLVALAAARRLANGIRVLRAPHHTTSPVSLRGTVRCHEGAQELVLGELALAHDGVLYLSEADEFPRQCIAEVCSAIRLGYVEVRIYGRPDPIWLRMPARPAFVVCSAAGTGGRNAYLEQLTEAAADARV